ncbi:MAG: hypothetical protein SAK29_32470 [Scytonema sp. PMC 1069.18]|nr:hypothetical protein [Scytonema sp. PMC 1069.18]MEC4888047.1 hypothetical protein [Scytonema sp. PMC 1070.18]
MSATKAATVCPWRRRMTLPSPGDRAVQDLQDEIKWNNSFQKTQNQLVAAAQKAKRTREKL